MVPVPRRRRKRRGTFALVALVVLAGALAVADVIARSATEHQISASVVRRTGAASATAQVGPFPFLFHLLAEGTIPDLEVQALDVPAGPLRIARVAVSARNVRISRRALLSSRRIRAVAVASATASLTVTDAELSAATGHHVSVQGRGTLAVSLAGVTVPVRFAIAGGHVLTIEAGGIRLLSIDLTKSPFVPDCAMRLTVSARQLTLTCHAAPVPQAVVAVLSGT